MLGDAGDWHHCVKVSFCQFLLFFVVVLFCFPSGAPFFLTTSHLCMGFQWATVLSGLSLLWHGCCSCLKVFFCRGASFSKITFLATSPGMSPTTCLLFSIFMFLHIFYFSCAFSCLLLWFLLCLLMSTLLALALFKIPSSKGSLCSSDWLRIWWIDCYFHPVWWWLELTVTGTELFMASYHTNYTCSPLLLKQNCVLSDCSAPVISLPNLTHCT